MIKRPGSSADPLWYRDAIIYEIHVRCFHDANGDGVGDFRGLIEKLDYLEELGVTCLWILPFFPSPLRDDGYDIADYTSVHPSYGTLEDFQEFLAAAHERGMQVLIELVINHTSDQHPWFQAARRAPPGSPERDFYVWSDSDSKYAGTRVIFTDTHTSNWSWDPVAKSYYWHRFFSHQPDLNFDNPVVEQEVIRVMQFWLDLGVDALRLDAIPYLIEREGTNNENLPETHALLKRLRAALDRGYDGRMLLAEANQWPEDVRAYFGDEDECHMAFHFPLMPRLFMALRLEDRHPVTEIMRATPAIPATCQWGLFLRNHDELTLEMVSDEERDYMYYAYSADPRMRVNVGIRRRLAPLLENDRNRIELLHSILLSFPGTPILYYGDEIGMGDNIYLGDRHGVRTPDAVERRPERGLLPGHAGPAVQPAGHGPGVRLRGGERGGPAERAVQPAQLDPAHDRAAEAVPGLRPGIDRVPRAQQPEGAGLPPAERRRAGPLRGQPVPLRAAVRTGSLRRSRGRRRWRCVGMSTSPASARRRIPLTLGPYGFLWLELQTRPEEQPSPAAAEPALVLSGGESWSGVLQDNIRAALESRLLPGFLPRQRWYSGKARHHRELPDRGRRPAHGAGGTADRGSAIRRRRQRTLRDAGGRQSRRGRRPGAGRPTPARSSATSPAVASRACCTMPCCRRRSAAGCCDWPGTAARWRAKWDWSPAPRARR